MLVKQTQYTHMPNFHGLLINDTELFLSQCAWDSKKKLTAGKNFYEYYKSGIGEIHDHKIKLFEIIAGQTQQGKLRLTMSNLNQYIDEKYFK